MKGVVEWEDDGGGWIRRKGWMMWAWGWRREGIESGLGREMRVARVVSCGQENARII
jgi:hypothetical protein